MRLSLLSLVVCAALAPLAASAQDYSGQWFFSGHYIWADLEDPGSPFETDTFADLPPFQLQKSRVGYSLTSDDITVPLLESPQGDFFEFHEVDSSYGPEFNLKIRVMPADEDLLFVQLAGASYGRGLESGQMKTVLLDFESSLGVLTPEPVQQLPLVNIEGEYKIVASMSMYCSTTIGDTAAFEVSSHGEGQHPNAYLKRTGNDTYRLVSGNVVMELGDYGYDQLEYNYEGFANRRHDMRKIRVHSISGDRLLIFSGEADDAAGIAPMARTEVWLARKVSDNTGDAFPFFPGAGYPDAGGWIQWKNEWFYTLDAPWFYSYRTDWTYIEGNDPSYMWWWSWHFEGTGQGEWIWTNDVYFPWVWHTNQNWYNVSTF